MGSDPRRPAAAAGAGPRRVLGGAEGPAHEVGVQAPARREVSRRQPVQRRRRGLQLRIHQEEGRASLRRLRVRPGELPARLPQGHQEDRRLHRRVRDRQADELRALPGRVHGDRVAHAVAEVQGLAEVRRAAVRHRALQGDAAGAPRASRARGEQELLGHQAPAQDREADPLPDARADHAPGGPAERPGGLDRGAAARRDPAAQGGGIPDRAELLPAQLDAHPPARQGAVGQQARSQGGQLRHRSGRHLQEPAERHVHSGHGRRLQGPSVVRRSQGDLHVRSGQGQGAAQASGLR